jgi:riboflavin biosynthesis pyrimidine reductase
LNLSLLYEPAGLPAFDLPEALADLYPGTLGFPESCVFANFVATVDGVVAIPSMPQSNKLVAAGNPADRFVMGLLRACADAVIVGSGTVAASPGGLWTPAQAYPDGAALFAELRESLGLPPEPEVAILSLSGNVDPNHPVLAAGAHVLIGEPADVISALHARGHRRILHEGGPHVIGSFLAAGLVDELFLTVSPLLTGRTSLDERLALVEGADLLPGTSLHVLGARIETEHLFLRYGILPR